MNCPDKTVMELILDLGRQKEYRAVQCLRKCERQTAGVLMKMRLLDDNERRSIFYLALAEFILQVRQGKFVLSGAARICTYITEIAKRKWLDMSKKTQPITTELAETLPADESVDWDEDGHVLKALQQLNAADQDILVAFYFFDIQLEEYALRKKISYSSAKKRLSRARQRLKNILKP